MKASLYHGFDEDPKEVVPPGKLGCYLYKLHAATYGVRFLQP